MGFNTNCFLKQTVCYAVARNRVIDKSDEKGKLSANSWVDRFLKEIFFTITHKPVAIAVSQVFLAHSTSSVIEMHSNIWNLSVLYTHNLKKPKKHPMIFASSWSLLD